MNEKVYVLIEIVEDDLSNGYLDFIAISDSIKDLKEYVDKNYRYSDVHHAIFYGNLGRMTHWSDLKTMYSRKNREWKDANFNVIE